VEEAKFEAIRVLFIHQLMH